MGQGLRVGSQGWVLNVACVLAFSAKSEQTFVVRMAST